MNQELVSSFDMMNVKIGQNIIFYGMSWKDAVSMMETMYEVYDGEFEVSIESIDYKYALSIPRKNKFEYRFGGII